MKALTATQQRIYDLLKDGQPHTKEELHKMLEDEYSSTAAVRVHISRIRLKISGRGEDIRYEASGAGHFYRLVRLVGTSNAGIK